MNKPVSPIERLSIEAVLRMGSTRPSGARLWYLVAAAALFSRRLWFVIGGPSDSHQYPSDQPHAAPHGDRTAMDPCS
jgi:hypothetical protein